MKVRVSWESPDYYQPPEDTYEDIEIDDNATEEEIEKAVKETAFEHFEYGYEILSKKKTPKSNHEVIEGWRRVIRGETNEKKRQIKKKACKYGY